MMSKIIDPPSLGQHFGDVLTAAKEGSLEGSAVAVRDVCTHWEEFLSKAADRLRADLKAPSEGKQLTRLNWLTRQLEKAPPASLSTSMLPQSRVKLR